MRSHLLALLLFALAPSYSCSKRHFRGFDIWRNRVIGNGWDIAEKVIRGPDGFFWELNPQNPTPPSLPPPLNEIVWCPGCFLERAYGTPKWSVDMSKVRRAPITLAEIPDEPPILHLRGFDIWKNRVLGNDWDIQENFIKGPGGFSWEKSKATDTPPSLPPPLNEIVWCPDCFLGKAYGRPTWSVDMSSFRREPTLVEPPNKQTINIPISYQRYLQFPWQQPYMAPQPPFFIPGMRPSQYNIIPHFVMSQFPFKGMSNSNPSIFQRPPYGIPFSPSNGNLLFMNPNEPNLNLELPSEDDEVLIPSEEIAPLPKDEAKLLNPYPGIESFPKYDPTLSAKQNNEAKLPSEGQTQTPKNEDKLLTSQPKTEIAESEEEHYSTPSDIINLPPKEQTQPPKNEDTLLNSPSNLAPTPKTEIAESEEEHYSPPSDIINLPPKEQTQPPKNEDKIPTSPPRLTAPPKTELAESEDEHYSPPSDIINLPPKEQTQPPKTEDKLSTSPPSLTATPKTELAESEEGHYSPPSDMIKIPPKEQTQPPKNEDTLLNSPPNIAPGSTQKYVPPSRAQTNWRHLVSKAKQASKTPTKNDQEVPTKGLNSNEVFPDTTDNSSPVKQDSSIAQNMEDNNILDPILDFVSTLFSSKPSDLPKPTPLDFQNSIRDPELAEENGLKTKFPLEEEEGNVDKNTPVKNELLPNVGQPDKNSSSTSGDQTVPKIQEHPQKEIGSDVEDKKQKDNSSPVKQDSSLAQNIEDNNILDPILDFVSNLFSTKPSDLPKPTPLDVQNLIRDPELAEEKGLKTKYPLEKEGNVDKNTPVKNDLLPDVGQPDNDSSRSGDQTVPKIQQQPPKEIGSGVQDKKQEDGNTIISEDEDNTKTPENKEIKQEKSEVKEELPQNEKSKEEKPKTHDEPISENKEHKPEVQDENKELKELPQNEKSKEEKPKTHDEPISKNKEHKTEVQDENKELKEEKPENNKESPVETPDNHNEQVSESKEQKPGVQDEEQDQGRHGIQRPGVDFTINRGTIQRGNQKIQINGTKFNLLDTPGKVVIAKEYKNSNNQPVREVYLNGNLIEKYENKKLVFKRSIAKTKRENKKNNCDGIEGKFEDTIDFTKRFHRVYNDDLCLLSEVTPDSVHLKMVYKETGNLYEEKYTLGPDGKLIFQKINGVVTCETLTSTVQ